MTTNGDNRTDAGCAILFDGKSAAGALDCHADVVSYFPKALGRYIENTGEEESVFLEALG